MNSTRYPYYSLREGFIIVAGERRFRAFQNLNRETIPAILTSGDMAEIALIENVQREELHPVEEAFGLANLMELHGYKQEEVGSVVGKARATVTNLLSITSLPETILDECSTSNIPKSTLIEIARVKGEDAQISMWESWKNDGLSVRATRSKKKPTASASSSRSKTAGYNKVLTTGTEFATQLDKIASQKKKPPQELLEKLQTLKSQIAATLHKISEQSNADDSE